MRYLDCRRTQWHLKCGRPSCRRPSSTIRTKMRTIPRRKSVFSSCPMPIRRCRRKPAAGDTTLGEGRAWKTCRSVPSVSSEPCTGSPPVASGRGSANADSRGSSRRPPTPRAPRKTSTRRQSVRYRWLNFSLADLRGWRRASQASPQPCPRKPSDWLACPMDPGCCTSWAPPCRSQQGRPGSIGVAHARWLWRCSPGCGEEVSASFGGTAPL
mmetsp:Transcript_83026/g.221829  ORF Transcript_83026/g.221829 Transcript_83026/m.221829 type:complete len:212 (-) Transcript_83026:436-1071(-)